MEPKAVVMLKKGEGRQLKSGGLWIYDNEIQSIMGSCEDGDIVVVRDFDGYPMGRGFINRNSKITVRMLTRNANQDIDEAFLRMRVKNAWEYRKHTVDTCYIWRGRFPSRTCNRQILGCACCRVTCLRN